MEIHQLRYIVALSQELNFQRAARKAHISQPTLSQQVQKLEKELGSPLFERSASGARLTRAGEIFLPKAIAILDGIDQAISEIQKDSGELTGLIRLAAIPTIGPYVLPSIVTGIKKSAPKLRLEIFEETTSSIIQHIKEGQFDLGILSTPIHDRAIAERALGQEDFFLAVSKQHPLARRSRVALKDITKEKMLILQEGHCFSEQALEYCKKSRHDEQVIFQGSSLSSVMKLASTGEGVTLVPSMAVEPQSWKDLRFIPFNPPSPKRELGVIWRMSAPLQKAHLFLIEAIRKAMAQEK